MSKVRILIVEDDLIIAEEMSESLRDRGFSVLDISPSIQNAKAALEIYQVDIVLVDIKLQGKGDGITLAKFIRDKYALPVIFTTSFVDAETISRAFEANPSAYLVKPYNYHELEIAIAMALYNFENGRVAKLNGDKLSDQNHFLLNDHIFVKDRHRFERVQFSDIPWLKAESSYVMIHTNSKDYLLTSDTLGSLMARIEFPNLVRCHRSYAVNIDSVKAIEGNQFCIGPDKIPIGKSYRSIVKQYLHLI